MTRNVRVTHGHRDGWTAIETPYDEDFVEDLKSEIPHRQRSWNPATKTWHVAPEFAEYVVELVVHHFGETLVVDEGGNEDYIEAGGVVARQERML